MKRKNSYEIGEAVTYFLQENGLYSQYQLQQVFSQWNEIVGDAIDKATLGLSFQDGRLEIQVGSSVWYQELSYQRSEILTKVNTWLGEDLVTEVSIVQHKSGIGR